MAAGSGLSKRSDHGGHLHERNDTPDQRLAICRWDDSVFPPSCARLLV